jgi:hypothetical protein
MNSWLAFHQGFQTLENNGIHSTVRQAIFNLKNTKDNTEKPLGRSGSCFHCLSCFTNSREQQKLLGKQPREFHRSCAFGNLAGKTLALVYEILLAINLKFF